ncbi:hypothetical protein F503_02845 [Ophiostoma piceae UAMH 11346]|uniref:Uncharacterized protein n=1 Tax=Ophiostoma piceae (strain UAMH 11346) TaxID=1262450 RepID=S3C2M7_OPHP1|nr:hypothetical protein F503_02845 [Ophiostoma piceae UAMH 11346]
MRWRRLIGLTGLGSLEAPAATLLAVIATLLITALLIAIAAPAATLFAALIVTTATAPATTLFAAFIVTTATTAPATTLFAAFVVTTATAPATTLFTALFTTTAAPAARRALVARRRPALLAPATTAIVVLFAALLFTVLAAALAVPAAFFLALLETTAVRRARLRLLLVGLAAAAAVTTRRFLVVAAVLGALPAIGVVGARVLGLCVLVGLLVAAVLRVGLAVAAVRLVLVGHLRRLFFKVGAQQRAGSTQKAAEATTAARVAAAVAAAERLQHAAEAARARAAAVTAGKTAGEAAKDGTSSSVGQVVVATGRSEAGDVLLHLEGVATAVAGVLDALLVVLAVLDTLARQLAAVVLTLVVGHILPPLLHAAVHDRTAVRGTVAALLALGGVVQDAVDNAVERAGNVNVVVVPGVHDLGNGPGNDLARRAAGNLVENVAEVVLGQHRVGGVRAVVVVEDNELLGLAALDDLRGARGQLGLDLLDDRHDKGSNNREDKDGQLVLELLNHLRQHGDLLDGLGDVLQNLVMVRDGGHDLVEDVLDVAGKLLGLARRHAHLLHLGSSGVALDVVHLLLLVAAAKDAVGNHVEQLRQHAGVGILALLQRALELLDLVLGQLVRDLTSDRVQEVDATESASDHGVDGAVGAVEADAGAAADMGEDVALAHLNESQLSVVAVGEVVLKTVQTGAEETQGLVEVILVAGAAVGAAELDAAAEELAHVVGTGHDVGALVCNVVLHAGLGVDAELDALVDGATQAGIVAAGIDVVGVVLGVVDVVLGAVAAQTVGGDLELFGAVAKGQEAENTEQQTDGLGRDGLDGTDIDGLAVVAQPVAKVDTRDRELVKLLAADGAGHEQLQ